MNDPIPAEALDRFKHFLDLTGSARTAAGVTNKQMGLTLTTDEYKELLERENRPLEKTGERTSNEAVMI